MGIMNLAELLDSSVSILRKYSKSFIIFNLGYWTIATVVLFILLIVLSLGMTGTLIATDGAPSGILLFMLTIFLLAVTMGACNSVGAIHLASQDVLRVRWDAAGAIGSSVKSTFRVGGLVFLGAAPLIPLGYGLWRLTEDLIMTLVGKTSSQWLEALGSADQRMLLMVSGLLGAFLVVLILVNAYLTLFVFALPAMVLERRGPVSAIRRSVQLVRGRFWHLYGAVSLIALVTSGIGISLDSFFLAVSGLVELVLHFAGIEPGIGFTVVYGYGRGIANFVYALLFNSLGAVIFTALYHNRLFETEGYDLLLRLSRIPVSGQAEEGL